MAYSKGAQDNYRKKCKQIGLKYTPNELHEYNRIVGYCKVNHMTYQNYIKSLIKADLDAKGIPYPIDDNMPD
ncbi:hypothetical protein Ccl03g_33070 [Enterocloster clostridioformis]|jgi:hypothetical protein|uniref:Uncharacterized protein n=1 Tax=Enterocloster clostridioformis TaxID=1531 RepID=A0A829WC97_9FIRM|nr:hypothetical protein HMPREF1087_01215 [[Clostridium] clostridioforme 90A1]ENZ72456.1 hypothetical protein HMPREF1081_00873 [[Clostridium] clostridioforme 90A4]GEA37594.1 hypothetical protein Ccl03g_33070 [Enterocloster clostridioformis]